MTNTPKGSIIWNLSRRCIEFFSQHLYRILGNGRQTFLWEDKILGNAPLNSDESFNEIKSRLVDKDIHRISDFISWDCKGNWKAWSFPELSARDPNFHTQENLLMEKQSAIAPIHISCKDSWGWGTTGVYSTAEGYTVLQKSQTSMLPSTGTLDAAYWKLVWNYLNAPKIIFFIWTVMHQKVLTGENMLK